MPTCSSCGAEIIWCVTTTEKKMPVDATENPSGNVFVLRDSWGDPLAFSGLDVPECAADPHARITTHTSHFATCPNASQHRRPRGQGGLPGVA